MSDFDLPATMDGRQLAKEDALDGQGLKALIEAGMTWLKSYLVTLSSPPPFYDFLSNWPKQTPIVKASGSRLHHPLIPILLASSFIVSYST